MEIWVGKVGNFEKKNGNLGKYETSKIVNLKKLWKSGKVWKFWKKIEIWKNKWKFRKILETLKIFRYLEMFGNYLEIWTIENLEKEIWK